MRILICDDEQKLIDLELSILQEYCRSTNIAATFFTFTDSLSAGNIGEFDIAFLDIDMEKLNGIELARKLRSKNPTSIIIFVTNFIRRLCREVPGMAFQSGIKWYINLGKMADYFNGGTTTL